MGEQVEPGGMSEFLPTIPEKRSNQSQIRHLRSQDLEITYHIILLNLLATPIMSLGAGLVILQLLNYI